MKTTILSWRIAIRAATRKVLSPISENMIIVKDRKSECMGEMNAGSWDGSRGLLGAVLGLSGMMVSSLGEDGFSGMGMSWDLAGRSVGT